MSDPLYAIPDIHGHKDKLDQALALVEADGGASARIVFLGDYVDRGPDSRSVLQTLINGKTAGKDWIFLRGNHDDMFLDCLAKLSATAPAQRAGIHWLSYASGSVETLASYGVTAHDSTPAITAAIPAEHQAFLLQTRLFHETGDLIFAHAGLRPGVPLSRQSPRDLMYIREPFQSDPRDHGKLVVHGHVPLEHPAHFGNRIGLDGGAGWGRALCPAVFEGRRCWLLTKTGRQPLRPQQGGECPRPAPSHCQ